ncbi:MAG: bifunctional UDP-N-acetylglucosamine diphosphorylase/glucosamine-1-phosphate N-acetyltransferase GlmU [Desulfomonile tiedjei]|uniref:Bifunctional protein GlmU n=1 Tax=Desulfomonile tiedjei TaxID=2358 RepID=A0A9D6Z3V9_9BACT|nr:bifunctional UDP-N-acetylglucosamine diphosphorylase/glucosamine-1-phosphate N-acetyltransferase GlmU [Desulfomonile tiedjei]
MDNVAALILAAGKGTRMRSGVCKVLHAVAGRPMISYVIDAVRACSPDRIALVVGHQSEDVIKAVGGPAIEFAVQEPQLGTGHAVMAAGNLLREYPGDVLILCGDIPLIRQRTLSDFIGYHKLEASKLTVMTTRMENPYGYGRIVRDSSGFISAIVEEKDASDDHKRITEVNTGIYLAHGPLLFSLLERVGSDNAQEEYYLTDIVKEATKESEPVRGFKLRDSHEAIGINSRSELARVSGVIWCELREQLMESGVTLLDPGSVYIDSTVSIGQDTVIHPCVTLSGDTVIGRDCIIESGTYIINSKLGDGVRVLQGSRLDSAEVMNGTQVGPMAHLRPEAKIGQNARIGNFVEVKKSTIGDRTKASHLTYIGDASVGTDVNIGCGTITCNYDGKQKHRTVINDRCFVGSDVQFVAPVEIGQGSVIGAGSTITRDVPPRSLAVARTRQKVYALREGQGPGPSSGKDRKDEDCLLTRRIGLPEPGAKQEPESSDEDRKP